MRTVVVAGDISRIEADALVTAINSGGMWAGGIDGVIARNAGTLFHSQAAAALPLQHGETVVAHGDESVNQGAFKNVVFVIDDLRGPLHAIVYNGLKAASDAGFSSVTLPTIRMGVMLGVVEKSVEQAIGEMAQGVRMFFSDHPSTSLEDVTFVVYNDEPTRAKLAQALGC